MSRFLILWKRLWNYGVTADPKKNHIRVDQTIFLHVGYIVLLTILTVGSFGWHPRWV